MHKFDKLSILKIHPERYNGAKVERKIKRTLQKAIWMEEKCMSFADFKDNTMRAVVSKTIDGVLKYVNKHDDRTEALLKLTDLSEKLMGDKFEKKYLTEQEI